MTFGSDCVRCRMSLAEGGTAQRNNAKQTAVAAHCRVTAVRAVTVMTVYAEKPSMASVWPRAKPVKAKAKAEACSFSTCSNG